MTPLILLPGFMCDARLFAPQLEGLGRGDVAVPAAPSMTAMADAVLDAAPPRFALAGLSMGGILALGILARAPDRVERLALLDTTPRADAPANHAIRSRHIAEVRAGGMDRVMMEELKPAYLAEPSPAILDLCLAMARDLGPEVFEAQALALRDRGGREDLLPRIAVPTLVLCGAEDRLCPPDLHREMAAAIPGARLDIVPRAGHLSTLEAPDAVTAALRDWLEA